MTALSAVASLAAAMAQLPAEPPHWMDTATRIATLIIAVALTVAAVALVTIALAVRPLIGRLGRIAEVTYEGVGPLFRSALTTAENLSYISASARAEVDQVRATLLTSQRRLNDAAQLAEKRINEFSALLEVVQEEAEELFIDTASTLRGVRAGAGRLQRFRGEPDWQEAEEEEETPREPRRR